MRINVSEYQGASLAEGRSEICIPETVLSAAVAQDRRYNILGLFVGLVIVLVGALLLLAGVGVVGDASDISIPIPGSDDPLTINSAVPGVIFAVLGVVVIWITRPTVVTN